jgi:hypothetical protein
MASLSIGIRVFVASSSDVKVERRVAEQAVLRFGRDHFSEGLVLMPFLWEVDAYPTSERAQDALNRELHGCDLVLAIIRGRVGTGLQEEIDLAKQLVDSGRIDNLFVYFRRELKASSVAAGSAADTLRARLKAQDDVFFQEYRSTAEFTTLIARHLDRWSAGWRLTPGVVKNYLVAPANELDAASVGDGRLLTMLSVCDVEHEPMRSAFDLLGRTAAGLYQASGPEGFRREIPVPEDQRLSVGPLVGKLAGGEEDGSTRSPLLVDRRGYARFASAEWFFLACAWGLLAAVKAGDPGVVKRRPYVNPIHQYLTGLIKRSPDTFPEIVDHLRAWLNNKGNVTAGEPIARNFAAYVLGMIGAHEATMDLVEAARYDEGLDVRRYALLALAKLGARRHVVELVRQFQRADSSEERNLWAQAVCRMLGIARFEL